MWISKKKLEELIDVKANEKLNQKISENNEQIQRTINHSIGQVIRNFLDNIKINDKMEIYIDTEEHKNIKYDLHELFLSFINNEFGAELLKPFYEEIESQNFITNVIEKIKQRQIK